MFFPTSSAKSQVREACSDAFRAGLSLSPQCHPSLRSGDFHDLLDVKKGVVNGGAQLIPVGGIGG